MEQEHGRDCLVEKILFGKEAQPSPPHLTPQELLYLKEKKRRIR